MESSGVFIDIFRYCVVVILVNCVEIICDVWLICMFELLISCSNDWFVRWFSVSLFVMFSGSYVVMSVMGVFFRWCMCMSFLIGVLGVILRYLVLLGGVSMFLNLMMMVEVCLFMLMMFCSSVWVLLFIVIGLLGLMINVFML